MATLWKTDEQDVNEKQSPGHCLITPTTKPLWCSVKKLLFQFTSLCQGILTFLTLIAIEISFIDEINILKKLFLLLRDILG